MKWWKWMRRRNENVEAARRRRIAAEEQWQREQQATVRPLVEMMHENHISPLLDRLVQRRVQDNDSNADSN